MLTSSLAVIAIALLLFLVAVWFDPKAAHYFGALLFARYQAVTAARSAYRDTWSVVFRHCRARVPREEEQ